MFVAPAFPLNTAGSFRLFPALCSESGRSAALNLRQARLLRRTKEHIARFRKKQRTCGFHCIRVRVSDLLCKKSRSSGMLLRLMINYVRSDFSKSFPIKALQGSGSDQADDSKQRSQAPV